MADPITWTVLESVKTRLASITLGNGYRTNAGLTVTLEPEQIPEGADDSVLAVVLDSLQKPEDPALRRIGRSAVIAIYAKLACEMDDRQRRLHDILADIDQAMANGHKDFAVGTAFPQFLDAQAIPAAEGMKWTGAVVRYSTAVRLR